MKITRVAPSSCWHCGAVHDALSGVNHKKKPRPGAVLICVKCGQPSILDGELRLREPREAEWLEIGADKPLQEMLIYMQAYLREHPR